MRGVQRLLASALMVLGLLAPAPALAYLVKHTGHGSPVRWQCARVDVAIHESLVERVGHDAARRAAGIATEAWRGYGAPDLSLAQRVDATPYHAGAPGISVAVLEPWPHAPHLLAVTATTYREEDGVILDADVLVSPSAELALLEEGAPQSARFDLGAVLTHELGHAVGLGESEEPTATMWPRIRRGDTHQRTLADDDVDGVEEAYRGVRLVPIGGCGGASVAMSTGPALPVAVLVLVAIGLALAWRRRNAIGAARRGRRWISQPAGLVFAGALALVGVPAPNPAAPAEPAAVRASRALSASELPAPQRAAWLRDAAADPDATVRLAALSVVLRGPRREDAAIAGSLCGDGDDRVARTAREALAAARVARPSLVADADEATLARFAGAVRGEARVVSVEAGEDGLLHTRVAVGELVVSVPGGCAGGVCTEVGESLAPRDGEELLVAPSGAWARVDGELAFDGWIAAGVAVAGVAR